MSGTKPWLGVLTLLAMALAGCAEGATDADDADGPKVDATETTGGIRGIVVDASIEPVAGATMQVLNTDLTTTTDEMGGFVFDRMEPGTYFVEASAPLHTTAQRSVEVEAGVREPPLVKFQLERTVTTDPYMTSLKFEGFLVCSIGHAFFASEECGEGVGVPGVGRVGGQENNHAQFDFFTDGPLLETMVVEQAWDATTADNGDLFTVLATNWTCDPVCDTEGGQELGSMNGGSPLHMRYDGDEVKAAATGPDIRFSTFTWADWAAGTDDPSQTNVVLNQQFDLFVSLFYVLPAPDDWSFLEGDRDPYA